MFLSAPCYAHTVDGRSPAEWELLEDHLQRVSELAASFAGAFKSAPWGQLAGAWHDLGKYQEQFQRKLRGDRVEIEHAGLGAALACEKHRTEGLPLAFAIAGHHAGLANLKSNESLRQLGADGAAPLLKRLQDNQPALVLSRPRLAPKILAAPLPEWPAWLCGTPGDAEGQKAQCRSMEFWTRMLFSGLVDADRRATAWFYAQHAPALLHEELSFDSLGALRQRLDEHIDRLGAGIVKARPVNQIRAQVLAACRARAQDPPGRFSLTVPTGGGKTLSAMSFALNHAHTHGLRRVIVVIPYTSIIEQTAQIYRTILDDPARPEVQNVLEHHSNFDEQKLADQEPEAQLRRRLAAENWAAPIVVTTTVQFFESLFSNHPSRCRKLHNVAQSVIVLDEVQTLPPQYLAPILEVLTELTDHYGCSLVLSTATPPALVRQAPQNWGLTQVHEIIPDPQDLARRARRVRVTWPADACPTPYERLADELAGRERVLAIVHGRRDARELATLLRGRCAPESVLHLSALMCPAHRLSVLATLKRILEGSGPCRVVATQLVEAGVDIDFPVVYRALAGLDSLAQAAGRCDREGKLTLAAGRPAGELVVFNAPTPPPGGTLKKAMESTQLLLALNPALDPFDPAVCRQFFCELYAKKDPDEKAIQLHRSNLDFATVAWLFRLIENAGRAIVVPWGEGPARVEAYRQEPTAARRRALQPFTMQTNQRHYDALLRAGAIESLDGFVDVPTALFGTKRYDEVFGLRPDEDGIIDPELTIV